MKKSMTVCALVALSAISAFAQGQPKKWVLPSAFPSASNSSAPGSNMKKQSDFASKEEAMFAYSSSNFVYYVPAHLGGSYRNPVNGTTKKAFPLEGDQIMKMRIFGNGFRWVIIEKGTVCRYEIGADGQPLAVPYAHHMCGNDIIDAVYPPAKVATSVAPARTPEAPAPVYVQAPAPQVFVQVPAPQITLVPAPPTYITAPPAQVTVQQAPAPIYGPSRTSVLPQSRSYDFKPNYQPTPAPFVPEKKWSVGKKWVVGIGVVGGLALIYSLTQKDKKDEPKRAVVTD